MEGNVGDSVVTIESSCHHHPEFVSVPLLWLLTISNQSLALSVYVPGTIWSLLL
jgi:hypothetical protein